MEIASKVTRKKQKDSANAKMTDPTQEINNNKAMFFPLAVLDDLASPSFENTKKLKKKTENRKAQTDFFLETSKLKN